MASTIRRTRMTVRSAAFRLASTLLASTALTPAVMAQNTLPQGGAFVAGRGAIAQSGSAMTVTQATRNGVINWNSFSIGSGNSVHFDNGSGATLNRVTGGSLSTILGTLSATGSLYVVNPQGVVIGSGGVVTTGGSFVASALDMANDHFMAGGSLLFKGKDGGEVHNLGKISSTGGNVVLIAREVTNDGTILAPNGTAALAGGTEVLLSEGGSLVRVIGEGRFDNQGTIKAAEAELKAAGGNIYALAGNTDGIIRATGTETRDGRVWLSAGTGSLATAGTVTATDADGSGGSIAVDAAAGVVMHTGTLSATGTTGGSVSVTGDRVVNQGTLSADGRRGAGGSVDIDTGSRYIATAQSTASASGKTDGGSVRVAGDGTLFSSGAHDVTGQTGAGGSVDLLGDAISLVAATVDASGATAGGSVRIGGDFQGKGDVQRAETVLITAGTTITADATVNGDGGRVIVWSDDKTDFFGSISARGGADGGDGGFIEISSKDALVFGGHGDAGAAKGTAGTLLLDPKNITISDAASLPTYELIDPNPNPGNDFGYFTLVLSSGNIVVASSYDDTGAENAGAVYLYNGTTGALISTLMGSSPWDVVGSFHQGGLVAVGDGNFVVISPDWDDTNFGRPNVGAVTWGSGTTGVSGFVSSGNSLVGELMDDALGSGGVTVLANGNYVISSPNFDAITYDFVGFEHFIPDAGAVTWGSGASGSTGSVGHYSLLGTSAGDRVSSGGVTALPTGNYVVSSPDWDNGTTIDAGAATWVDGEHSAGDWIGSHNSLVGTQASDRVSSGGVTAMTTGLTMLDTYVVSSPLWDNDTIQDAGAATWGMGGGGVDGPTIGAVSASNSLVGGTAGDHVSGSPTGQTGGVTPLRDGHYVVASPYATINGQARAGAATWGRVDGTTVGVVTAANSLVGSTVDDYVGGSISRGEGGVTALTNGHYVVASPRWANGLEEFAGAVTWGNGDGTTTGYVSTTNSLVGALANNEIGARGVTALEHGDYVIASPYWRPTSDLWYVGAVTWASGSGPTTGVVSASNSLVGSQWDDMVGDGDGHTPGSGAVALTSGHYVVVSPQWANGPSRLAGAVTWGNGLDGTTVGAVSASNSLVGTQEWDEVGDGGVTALSDGHYLVSSQWWNNGLDAWTVGAVTWGNGWDGTTTGAVSATNSLIGAAAGDTFGNTGVEVLPGGHYVAGGRIWGWRFAVGDTDGGTVGAISDANSFVGPDSARDMSYYGALDGGFVVGSPWADSGRVYVVITDPARLTYARAMGNSVSAAPSFLTNVLNTGTAVVLQASNDITINSDIIVNAGDWTGGALTLQAGRSLLLNASIFTDGGALTLIANDRAANGVVETQRDPGAAEITMASGATINTGQGLVTIEMRDGGGIPNAMGGTISLGEIWAGTINVLNQSTGGGIVLNGTLSAWDSGDAIVLAADGTFTNNAGPMALAADFGRWLVYSADPRDNTVGGLSGANYYNVTHALNAPGTIAGTDNRFLHSMVPTLTVTADDANKVYGAAVPTLTYAVSGLIAGDSATDVLSGGLASAGISSNVGAHDILIGTLAAQRGYDITYVPGTLTITKAALTVTVNDAARTYGAANPTFGATYSGFVLDQDASVLGGSLTTTATQASDAGIYAISGAGLTSGNYAITSVDGTLTVDKAALTVTAHVGNRTYGAANPTLGATYSGFVLGQAADVLGGTLEVTTAATQSSDVGIYGTTASGLTSGNYAITYVDGALTVDKAALTVTATDASRTYGAANPTLGATYAGFVLGQDASVLGGSLGLTTAATQSSNVGAYAINASGLTSGNYAITHVDGTLTVDRAVLTVTANDASRTYGAANPTFSSSFSGFVLGQDASVLGGTLGHSSADSNVDAGLYTISNKQTLLSDNYAFTYVNGTLTVDKAALTVTVNDAARTYGAANPAFTATYSGFVLGQDASVLGGGLTTAATQSSNVGAYAITGNHLVSGNYAITSIDGTLTVDKAALTVTASDAARTYGAANPTFGATYSGFVLGQDASVLGGSLTSTATQASSVGTYAISGAGLTSGNYTITAVDGTLTVDKAALTVTINDASRTYGAANPTFGVTYAGFVLGQDASVLGGRVTTAATQASNVGTYAISGAGLTSGNYAITHVDGTLTVDKAALTVTANDASRTYGTANPAFGVTYAGFVLGQGAGVLGGSLGLTTVATQSSDVGTYAISGAGLTSGNYAITYADGTLTVDKAALTVAANDASRESGTANPVFTASYDGFVLGQDTRVLGGALSLVTAADRGAAAGTYAITGSGLTSNNYALTYVPGTLTVRAVPVVAARFTPPPMPVPVPAPPPAPAPSTVSGLGAVPSPSGGGGSAAGALAMAARQGQGLETAVDAGGFRVIYRQNGQEDGGFGGYSIFNEVLTENFATSTTVALTENEEAGQ